MSDRWLPETEGELEAAFRDGRLDEGVHLDFKAELKPGRAANVELARDVAMFANNGGTLVIGVAEPESGRFELSPVELDGVRERIEQVTRSRLDPPLHVDVVTVRSETDSGLGYLLVRIPASPAAPHMTDGRYWGRAGSTREVLSDSQVRTTLREREDRLRPIMGLLADDVARDPVPSEMRSLAHLFVVGRPRFAPDDLVLRSVQKHGGDWSAWILRELFEGQSKKPRGGWSPDVINQAGTVGRRAKGAALYSHYVGQDRSLSRATSDPDEMRRSEDDLLDLEIDEDGTLHLFCGRGTDILREGDRGDVVTFPGIVAGLTMRVVDAASRINHLTGFVGTWDFAVALVGARGARPYLEGRFRMERAPAYTSDDYRSATAADTAELAAEPEAIGERLTGQLLRALGVDATSVAALVRRTDDTESDPQGEATRGNS